MSRPPQPMPAPPAGVSPQDGTEAKVAEAPASAGPGGFREFLGRAKEFLRPETGYARHPRTSPVWRWWRPLITMPLAFGCFLMLLSALLIGGLLGGLWTQDDVNALGNGVFGDQASLFFSPVGALLVVGGLALMPLALACALWTSRERPVGTLMSVAGRPRWKLFAKALAFAFVTLSLSVMLQLAIEHHGHVPVPQPIHVEPWIVAVLVVALPLQCLAEEILFRGYAMQTVASWMPKRVAFPIALVAQAVLFMLGHAYDLPGQLAILASGLIWGWVAEKTGGLETSVAFHIANNVLSFLVMGFGLTVISDSVPLFEAAIDGAASVLMPTLFVLWGAKRGWIGNAETIQAGQEPCRMFGSQYDALMWERIQQEQLEDWNRFMSQMPEMGAGPQPALPDGIYAGDAYVDGEATVVGVGESQYGPDMVAGSADMASVPAPVQPVAPPVTAVAPQAAPVAQPLEQGGPTDMRPEPATVAEPGSPSTLANGATGRPEEDTDGSHVPPASSPHSPDGPTPGNPVPDLSIFL